MDKNIKINPNYTLCNIAGTPYLLPYGQGIADHCRGIQLNKTGVFLWNTLQQTTSQKDLLNRTAAYYEADQEELPIIEQDISAFLNQLAALGILQYSPYHCAGIPESDTQHNHDAGADSGTQYMHDAGADSITQYMHGTDSNILHNQDTDADSNILHNQDTDADSNIFHNQDTGADSNIFHNQDTGADSNILHNHTAGTDSGTDSMHLKIGPILLHLLGPLAAFAPEFQPFATSQAKSMPAQAELTIELKTGGCRMPAQGIPLIRHPELCVFETDSHYQLQFQAPQLTGAWLAKDGSYACIYHTPPYDEPFVTDLFHAIRFLFLYTAQRCGCFALHSASILYHEKAWLFSGPSGMGKSTHTGLWKAAYGTPILNGDLNLLSFSESTPVIYGIPWCGTSGISDTAAHPLGGIILLKRAVCDSCQELPLDKKILLISQRLIAPAWTASMLKCNLDFISSIVPHIAVCMLGCTKKPSAAAAMKRWIDETC